MAVLEKHKIYVRHCGVTGDDKLPIPLIKQCIRAALDLEGVDVPCEVNVLITTDSGVSDLNNEFRGFNEPTDVLSFPMREFSPPGWLSPGAEAADPETGLLPLGEIALSSMRVDKQATEYGHSREYETAYLIVHSMLHLLGYDHTDESEGKIQMREREKRIMRRLRDIIDR